MPSIRSLALSFVLAAAPLVACGSQTTGSGSSSSALTDDAAISAADFAACLTSYVECLRADGADGGSCRDALHACLPKPPGHHGHGGPPGCDGDGPKGPPPDGDAAPPPAPTDETGAPLPPPDHDRDGDRPPPPDGDGGIAPPPRDDSTGPHACIKALETCAAGTDAVATCVDAAVACFDALPKPPPPPAATSTAAPSATST